MTLGWQSKKAPKFNAKHWSAKARARKAQSITPKRRKSGGKGNVWQAYAGGK